MKKLRLTCLSLISTIIPFAGFTQMIPTYDDVFIPMSDGDSLEADIYIPAGVDSAEVILIQTPYNKNWFAYSLPMGVGTDLDTQPYIWVIVDWRGFYGSSGADLTSVDRGQDAFDVCDWIVSQTWHKDRIGTWGPSALGGIQYQLIDKHHPNHVAAVPLVATGSQAYETYFYGGVLEEARLYQLDALGYGLSPTVLANPYYSILWSYAATNSWYSPAIDIPTLQIGGWYDHTIDQMMNFYKSSRNDADAAVLDKQWLLVGPWVHGGTGAAYVGSAIQGELTYDNAEFVSDTMAWDFLAYYLLDSANGWETTDLVTYYELGSDQWLTSNADDIAATSTNDLFLTALNRLTSETGAGTSTFVSDPSAPSPTIGGATLSDELDQGPFDQNSLNSRSDLVTFQTDVLNADVTATGRIVADLYISADQPDCDVAIRLVDVYPDGRSMLISDGIKRMRFRGGDYTEGGEEFMTAGTVYNVQVDLPFTNYTWKSGHRIKIYVSGNHASRFNVNLQDGGAMYTAGTGNVANITVHHDATYPSKITLPGSNPTLKVSEDMLSDNLLIYPVPASDFVVLSSDVNFEYFELLDLSGRVILSDNIHMNSINVENIPNGIYILKVNNDKGNQEMRKIMIER